MQGSEWKRSGSVVWWLAMEVLNGQDSSAPVTVLSELCKLSVADGMRQNLGLLFYYLKDEHSA